MPGSGLKVYGGGGGGVRTKFSVQLWSQAEQHILLYCENPTLTQLNSTQLKTTLLN